MPPQGGDISTLLTMTGGSRLRSMGEMSADPYQEPAAPALAALRQARVERVAVIRRWALTIGLASVMALAVTIWRSAPQPGLQGTSLGIALAACGFLAAMLAAIWLAIPLATPLATPVSLVPAHAITTRAYPAGLALLVASSVALELLQPRGPALAGLFLAVYIVARVFEPRLSAALLVACLAFITGTDVAGVGGWSGLSSLVGLVALVAVFGVSLSGRRIQAQEKKEERLLAELEQSRAAELRGAALAERQRVAREVHDVLAHSLSGLVVQLEGTRLLAATAPSDARLPLAMDRARQLACDGLDEARQAIAMLRGGDLPGPRRLAELADGLAADLSVPCRFSEAGPPRDLAPAVRLALYRVTQEALTNVRKHACPDKVEVRLEYLPAAVTLAVQDFGAARAKKNTKPGGLVTGEAAGGATSSGGGGPAGGYGLTGMRERARLLGGSLDASSTHDGFLVLLRVPV